MTKFPFIFYILCLLINICCEKNDTKSLHIAASANLQYAIKELINQFEKQKKTKCKVVIGSSGKLTSQIKNGAPFDVFLSANKKYTDFLTSEDTSFTNSKTFAYGKLVIASKEIPKNQLIDELEQNNFSKLAMPNPKFAPYGEMAFEFLQNKEIYPIVKDKLVYGESVTQTNQFLFTNNVELAFTSLSTVITNKNVNWIAINETFYKPKAHEVMVTSKKNKALSNEFIDFLLSKKAQLILKKYGYGVVE